MECASKIKKYEDFLNNVLKEDLRKELERRDKFFENIAAHSQLKQTIECLLQEDLSDGLRTQVDLGCNFYSQAHIPDPSEIYVKIGLDVYLKMTLREAQDYCEQKIKILLDEVALSTDRSAKIKAKIRFVDLALRELLGLDSTVKVKQRENLFAL